MISVAHFSLEHYEHMVESGAFAGKFQKRLELLRGEIVDRTPIGTEHCYCVTLLTDWSYEVVAREQFAVRVQNPIRIPTNDSSPEPDLVWVTQRVYSDRHPGPKDVALLIEVAESSLEVDRGFKLQIYAEAGIPEYWIINLVDHQIEVYRQPKGKLYLKKSVFTGDDPASPLVLPEVSLPPSRLFSGK